MRAYLVFQEGIAYWKDPDAEFCGLLDPTGQLSLFFKDLELPEWTESNRSGFDTAAYEKRCAEQLSKINEQFPLLVRMEDYYKDASFNKDEVVQLINEIHDLGKTVKYDESKSYLNDLLRISEAALEKGAAISFRAD